MHSPLFWWSSTPTLAARLLAPLGWAYGMASTMHGNLRASRAQPSPIPVINVGNLTVGGAGKTPLVQWIAENLTNMGHQVAIVSRGYGGSLNTMPIQVNPAFHTAADVGDEPLSLAFAFPHNPVTVWIGRHRPSAVRRAIQAGATVVVLDDAFQRRDVASNLTLLVANGAKAPFGNGQCLPAGPLREPLSAIHRAHAVVVMNAPEAETTPQELAQFKGPVFHLATQPQASSLAPLQGHRLLAFCGLAHPEKFLATLTQAGLKVVATHFYPDHHPYTQTDIKTLQDASHKHQAMRVTTAKDATKLPANFAYVLNITLAGANTSNLLKLLQQAAPAPAITHQ